MQTIYKYPIELTDIQFISLPVDSKFLTVDTQDDQLCIWATVNTEFPEIKREIRIVGTGNPINFPCHGRYDHINFENEIPFYYIGTVKQGSFVWHVFWR